MSEGSLLRRAISSTQEAKIRELLEDEEDDDFVSTVRSLDIGSPSVTTTGESKEFAPGEFYGTPKKGQEKSDVVSEEDGIVVEDKEEKI